jgi:hypothetical protein
MSIVCGKLDQPRALPLRHRAADLGRPRPERRPAVGPEAPRPRLRLALATLWAVLAGAVAAPGTIAQPVAVEVMNASEPVVCAEKDNVTLTFASAAVSGFRIVAQHPAYSGALERDSFQADWTACNAADDPRPGPPAPPKRATLYEDIEMWVVGLTFHEFWRPPTATVRIGGRSEKNIHLLQLWMIRPMGGEEVLVLYPQDGYWRLRPQAPSHRAPTAFGSSVLIGPVDVEQRPIVRLSEVSFDPKLRRFRLQYERGGSATVRLAQVDQHSHTLEVAFDQPIAGRPFAALRSMYVTDVNNDVARIAVRDKGAKGWREDGIMTFNGAIATELWAGRVSVSRHNTSAPDHLFTSFTAADSQPRTP